MKEKILIVDDNINNLRLLETILADESFDVTATPDSLEVVNLAICLNPAAILLDVMMPGLDGFEVCRLLKKEPLVSDIPVIMITAKTDAKDLKNAFDLGAFDYIKKPIDEIEVIARVKSALRHKAQQDQLKNLAFRDGLTNLYNHAAFVELFEKEFIKGERTKNNLSFIMLDIDFFKKVNDTYGHLAGDIILRQVAEILMKSTRFGDIVGRYGGEEFAAVLPGTDKMVAGQISERIRHAVETNLFDTGTEKINITLSIGIYCIDYTEPISYSDAIKNADNALYQAKQNGRNRVEFFNKD